MTIQSLEGKQIFINKRRAKVSLEHNLLKCVGICNDVRYFEFTLDMRMTL